MLPTPSICWSSVFFIFTSDGKVEMVIDERMDGWTHGRMDAWMDGWIVCMFNFDQDLKT
jgi:hypothetical protein